MNIVECPGCHILVVPKTNGLCPSCQMRICYDATEVIPVVRHDPVPTPSPTPTATAATSSVLRDRTPEYLKATLATIETPLYEALVYCRDWLSVSPSEQQIHQVFRSSVLLGAASDVYPRRFKRGYNVTVTSDEFERPDCFPTFLSQRRKLITSNTVDEQTIADELRRNCNLIAVYLPGTCEDQTSEAETDGYIDWSDVPPWDTWVWLENGILIAWVPSWMMERIDSAIRCDAYDAYSWILVTADGRLEVLGWGRPSA